MNLDRIQGYFIKAAWFDPRTGKTRVIGDFENTGKRVFDPPGEVEEGNDWVLILDSVDA